MLFTELVRWWYTDGLRQNVQRIALRLDGTIDYFSMDLLIKTLFAPFRQDSVGKVHGPLEVQLRALVDKLFSRVLGAIIRSLLLVIGSIAIILQLVVSLLYILVWSIVPLLPVIGIVMSAIGKLF